MKYRVTIDASRADFEKIAAQSSAKADFMEAVRFQEVPGGAMLTVVPVYGQGEFYFSATEHEFQNLLDRKIFPESFGSAFRDALSAAQDRVSRRGIVDRALDAASPHYVALDVTESPVTGFDHTRLFVQRFNS